MNWKSALNLKINIELSRYCQNDFGLDALSLSDVHMISRITCLVYWQIARNTCSLIVQDAHVVRVFCETLTIYALK